MLNSEALAIIQVTSYFPYSTHFNRTLISFDHKCDIRLDTTKENFTYTRYHVTINTYKNVSTHDNKYLLECFNILTLQYTPPYSFCLITFIRNIQMCDIIFHRPRVYYFLDFLKTGILKEQFFCTMFDIKQQRPYTWQVVQTSFISF